MATNVKPTEDTPGIVEVLRTIADQSVLSEKAMAVLVFRLVQCDTHLSEVGNEILKKFMEEVDRVAMDLLTRVSTLDRESEQTELCIVAKMIDEIGHYIISGQADGIDYSRKAV